METSMPSHATIPGNLPLSSSIIKCAPGYYSFNRQIQYQAIFALGHHNSPAHPDHQCLQRCNAITKGKNNPKNLMGAAIYIETPNLSAKNLEGKGPMQAQDLISTNQYSI